MSDFVLLAVEDGAQLLLAIQPFQNPKKKLLLDSSLLDIFILPLLEITSVFLSSYLYIIGSPCLRHLFLKLDVTDLTILL